MNQSGSSIGYIDLFIGLDINIILFRFDLRSIDSILVHLSDRSQSVRWYVQGVRECPTQGQTCIIIAPVHRL